MKSNLQKVAARAGLNLIRRLVAGGQLEEAARLAKVPGVLKAVEDLSEYEGRTLLHRGRSPGHQIRPIGMGREQAATLVADPHYGIVVRKTHLGKGAVTVPAQMDLKAALGRKLTDEGFEHAPKFHTAFEGPAGRKMHFVEYVPPGGENPMANARAHARFQDRARELGYHTEDTLSKGNVMTAPDGTGKVLDAIVSRAGTPGAQTFHGRPTGAPKSHGAVMQEVFNPSVEDLHLHDQGIEAARRKLLRRAG